MNSNALKDAVAINDRMAFIWEFRKVDPRMEITAMAMFMAVLHLLNKKQGEPLYIGEVSEYLDMAKSTGSRNMRYLSGLGARGSKKAAEDGGLAWIELETDPDNMSRKIVKLTPLGAAVRKKIL